MGEGGLNVKLGKSTRTTTPLRRRMLQILRCVMDASERVRIASVRFGSVLTCVMCRPSERIEFGETRWTSCATSAGIGCVHFAQRLLCVATRNLPKEGLRLLVPVIGRGELRHTDGAGRAVPPTHRLVWVACLKCSTRATDSWKSRGHQMRPVTGFCYTRAR